MMTLLVSSVLFCLVVCWCCCAIAPVLIPDDDPLIYVKRFEDDSACEDFIQSTDWQV